MDLSAVHYSGMTPERRRQLLQTERGSDRIGVRMIMCLQQQLRCFSEKSGEIFSRLPEAVHRLFRLIEVIFGIVSSPCR